MHCRIQGLSPEREAGSALSDTAEEVPSTFLVEATPLQPETVPESAASAMEAEDQPADNPALALA